MHHPTDRIIHTTAFVTPVVEHWLEREIVQWVHPMKDRSNDPSHHERRLLPRNYISLPKPNREHLRVTMVQRVHRENPPPPPKTLPQRLTAPQHQWQNIPRDVQCLIGSMHHCCQAVVRARGGHNRYWHFAHCCQTYARVHVSRGFPERLFPTCTE